MTTVPPRPRYKPSVQGTMLQEHREAACVSREELALRYCARRENRALMIEKYGEKWSLEAEAERRIFRWIRLAERSYKPMPDDIYKSLHSDIDMMPAGATGTEIQAAVNARREREKAERQDHLQTVAQAHADRIAAMVWDSSDSFDDLDTLLYQELEALDGWTVNGRVSSYVMRTTLNRLADELRLTFPGRAKMVQ